MFLRVHPLMASPQRLHNNGTPPTQQISFRNNTRNMMRSKVFHLVFSYTLCRLRSNCALMEPSTKGSTSNIPVSGSTRHPRGPLAMFLQIRVAMITQKEPIQYQPGGCNVVADRCIRSDFKSSVKVMCFKQRCNILSR